MTEGSSFVFGFFFLFELLLFSALLVSFALFAAIVAFRQSLRVLCDANGVLIKQCKAGIRLRRLGCSVTGSQHDEIVSWQIFRRTPLFTPASSPGNFLLDAREIQVIDLTKAPS